VGLEAAQEKESPSQLGKRYGVHPVRVGQWKKQLLERAAAAFERPSGQDESRRKDERLKVENRGFHHPAWKRLREACLAALGEAR